MTTALCHRGPDDEGFLTSGPVGLGMRRLSIIDLAGGQQPISNEDGSVSVVLNGEIYNFQALRAELTAQGHHFATASDTESLVHGYEEYGDAFVTRLRGMFAFALWDERRQRLVVGRDRFGKKPLVYTELGGTLRFASELAALVEDETVPREVDPVALDAYLTYGYVPTPLTIYRQVFKLPPAHLLIWEHGRSRIHRYWQLEYTPKLQLDEAEAVERFWELFREAVRLRLSADVPLGAFLSGGLDSSAVVAAMSEVSDGPVRTFSIGFGHEDYDELRYARQVAQRYGTDHHELEVRPSALAVLPTLVRNYGEPYADSSAVPTYYVSQLAREHVTVALNGDGGDELFAGYERHWAALVASRLELLPRGLRQAGARALGAVLPGSVERRTLARKLRRFAEAAALSPFERYLRWLSVLQPELKQSLYTDDFRARLGATDAARWLRAAVRGGAGLHPLDQILRVDTLLYLPDDLLAKVDIASMASSLEARSPFLDHELAGFVARLPVELKLRGRRSKYLLRQALATRLPRELLTRPKMGFGVPLGPWFRGELRPLLNNVLLSPAARERGYFKPDVVATLVAEHVTARRDHAPQLWALVMLELWQLAFVDRVDIHEIVQPDRLVAAVAGR